MSQSALSYARLQAVRMARWVTLSSVVIVLVMFVWLGDERRAPDARGLGGVCESTSGCQEGTRCVDQHGVMVGQCSASCNDDSTCSGRFGAAVLCLGADLCARACTDASECPSGTQCNAYGWCERLGSAN